MGAFRKGLRDERWDCWFTLYFWFADLSNASWCDRTMEDNVTVKKKKIKDSPSGRKLDSKSGIEGSTPSESAKVHWVRASTGKIYGSKEAALADGLTVDQITHVKVMK